MEDPLATWVVRAQKGDRAAFEELVKQTHRRVYNLAYHLLSDAQEAEDLTQEVYLRAWRALPDFRGEAQFSTWLYRIALNTALNYRRSLRGREQAANAAESLAHFDAPPPDPAAAAATRDLNARLWAAVRRLAQRYRLVLALFYQHELSYAEIAEVLGLPIGTVKAQLNRARRALAALWREENGDDV